MHGMDVFMLKSYTRSKGSKGGTRQGRRPWPLPGGTLRGRLACVASVSVLFPSKDRAKNGRAVSEQGPRHFLALVSFLARSKPRISFLGLSLLRNSTETLATQARGRRPEITNPFLDSPLCFGIICHHEHNFPLFSKNMRALLIAYYSTFGDKLVVETGRKKPNK